ncbi:MAG: LysR family transcriptional regulator ArgP [Herbiconiux sp.]|uniref:LysR family transcriptional regulator ArgP n=1 Tax=Herbiconiux sp. TaxID=1871186 RepID=UPI001217BD46|nr:LysR family transcriptional regulator ArgP [Herbiconiux sp.]TAJ48897.1 MAG: LysR family transcriptional regulator ArgP [Herbiconiux sp.]
MDFEISQLAALEAAVSEGTFEAAARRLRVTPSAVSQRIKALETSVGRVLLQRSKPIEPTESGRIILRFARQIDALGDDVRRGLGQENASRSRMPIAVNADSLATWILPALAPLAAEIAFDFHREDQSHTLSLLRDGTAMAAITGVAEAVQGCSSTPLGAMRYQPMASRAFAARWFAGAPDASDEPFAHAPVVIFDRRDDLQDVVLRRRAARSGSVVDPPRHYVPASVDFVEAVRLGFGWGMVPELQADGVDDLVLVDPEATIDVPLYWQQWQLHTPSLEQVAATVRRAAAAALKPLAH